jgi:hypothetical protein
MTLHITIRLGNADGTLEGVETIAVPHGTPPGEVYTRLLQPVTRLGELVCASYRTHLERTPPLESLEDL